MRDIGATDVERPCNILGVGDQKRIGTKFGQLCTDAFKLVGRGFASKLELAQGYCAGRGWGAIAPQHVDWIAVDCH